VAEPTHERVKTVLKTLLQGIVANGGAPYWYTPAHVFWHPTFDGSCYGKDFGDTVYVLVGDRTHRTKNTNKTWNARMLFDLIVLRRLPVPYSDVNPLKPPAEPRGLIQGRLASDAENRLSADPTFAAFASEGLQVWDIQVLTDERDPELTDLEGWACAYLRVQTQYFYQRGAA
jgi:hypothetical protein